MNTAEEKTMTMHGITLPGKSYAGVSELIDGEAVRVEFRRIAGAVTVTTELFIPQKVAIALSRLITKHHDEELQERELKWEKMRDERLDKAIMEKQIAEGNFKTASDRCDALNKELEQAKATIARLKKSAKGKKK